MFAEFANLTECFHQFLKKNTRFFYPVLIVVSVKLVFSIFFYCFFALASTDTTWMIRGYDRDLIGNPLVRWPFLYHGWDSGWYLNIIFKGYYNQAYAFFPGYPISIYVFGLATKDFFASSALSSLIFGVAWIPFFQAIAEHYMTREQASRTTLLATFFPYVFLFTTLAYSESLFLFSSLASWYFYLNEKMLKASLLAAVATVTRMVGIIIVLPMFLDLLLRRERRRLLFTFIPAIALLAWLSYCFVNSGDWFASITAQNKYWNMYSFPTWLANLISSQRMVEIPSEFSGAFFTVLTSVLIYYSRKIDWRLTFYAVSSFLVILCFASMWSISRYLSFIFPLWMALGALTLTCKRRNIVTTVLCCLFLSVAFLLWYRFLLYMWVA